MGLQSKVAGVLVGSGAVLLAGGALSHQAVANDFQGLCSPISPATCTLDEPMGNDPATHGTVTVTRAGSILTFTSLLNPGVALVAGANPIQLCVTADTGQANPYVPTTANTCAGSHGGAMGYQAFPVVFDAGPLLATPGAPVWFALHVNVQDGVARTTYVVGSLGHTVSTTTTSASTTTTDPPQEPTTTSVLATTTTVATTTTLPPTTTTLATTTTQPATTTTTEEVSATTLTSQPATTTTAMATTTTTARASATTVTSPRATTTTAPARVLGVVFEDPSVDAVTPVLPRTGTSARTLLISGATLLCLGVWLLLLSTRRSPRGAHR